MKSIVQEEFVKAIRKAILDKEMAVLKVEKDKVVSILSDILCLGREAVYRRLRGEVKFTLEEITSISLKLDISIDSIIGIKDKEKSVIELKLIKPEDDFKKKYHENMSEYVYLLETMNKKYGDLSILSVFNRLPYTLYLHFENLAKFRLFKWAYQMMAIGDVTFQELILSDEIIQIQSRFISEIRKVKSSTIILSSKIFEAYVNDIYYFRNLNLITEDEVKVLKSELRKVLDELEEVSITGTYKGGSKLKLYLSDLDINYSNMLFKYNKHFYTYINVYELGGIESQNKSLCEYQNKWIMALKRYSKLISESNELERHQFFRRQRLILEDNQIE